MKLVAAYVDYLRDVRRYSERTVCLYGDALNEFADRMLEDSRSDEELLLTLNASQLRQYMVYLMEERSLSPKTINLHMSALSGFCRYLVRGGYLKSNPVRTFRKPRVEKRIPEFYRSESLEEYFSRTEDYGSERYLEVFVANPDTGSGETIYNRRLGRLIVLMLYYTGMRRSELLKLNIGDLDFGRSVVNVTGKGNKMREIPLLDSLCEEILLYLKAVEALVGGKRSLKEPLLITYRGRALYPMYVDRVIKSELGGVKGITGRKSPHVLRHSIATELMNEKTDLNSIKEMLGHSSLATTQVYTHSSFAQLKNIYEQAHPRAKNGGKHGD